MKKIVTMLLTFMMVMTMTSVAFAEEYFDKATYKEESGEGEEHIDAGYYLDDESLATEDGKYQYNLIFDESESGALTPIEDEEKGELMGEFIDIILTSSNDDEVETQARENTYSFIVEWEDLVFEYDYGNAKVHRVWNAKTKSYEVNATEDELAKIKGWNKKTAEVSVESHCTQTVYQSGGNSIPYIFVALTDKPSFESFEDFKKVLTDKTYDVKVSLGLGEGTTLTATEEDYGEFYNKCELNNLMNILEEALPNEDFSNENIYTVFDENFEDMYSYVEDNDHSLFKSGEEAGKEYVLSVVNDVYGEDKDTTTWTEARKDCAGQMAVRDFGAGYMVGFSSVYEAEEYPKATFAVNVGDKLNDKKADAPNKDCDVHFFVTVMCGGL